MIGSKLSGVSADGHKRPDSRLSLFRHFEPPQARGGLIRLSPDKVRY